MKKSLAAWTFLLIAMLGCSIFQPQTQAVPPLEFPAYAATYTPIIPNAADTPAPVIVTATPITPAPTAASVNLQKLGQWRQAEAQEALWYPDSGRFVIVSPQEMNAYKTATQQKLWSASPSGKDNSFQAVSLSANGNFIVAFQPGPAANVFDADSGELTEKKRSRDDVCPSLDMLKSIYLPDGQKHLLVAAQDSQKANAPLKIYKWGLSPYDCQLWATATPGSFASLLISPDQRFLVLSTNKGIAGGVTAWDVASKKELCSINGAAAAFHPNGRLAVADMQNNALVYWRVDSCQVAAQLPWASYSERQAMAFTPNGKYLLTFRRMLQVWDAKTAGLLLEKQPTETAYEGLLRISPDGRYLIVILNPNQAGTLVELWAIGDK